MKILIRESVLRNVIKKVVTEALNNANNNIIYVLLEKLQPLVEKMLEQCKESYFEETGQQMTPFVVELTKLTFTYDAVKAFEIYTLPTDKLISFKASGSVKGNIVISSVIQRDGTNYDLNTDVIYAGGHNVQRLHYRYLTKTKLPKTNSSQVTKEYGDKLKKMSAAEKIQNEIDNYKSKIEQNNERINNNINLTDEEIYNRLPDDKKTYNNTTWQDIVSRGADKNFDFDEDIYLKSQIEYKKHLIDFYKKQNILSPQIQNRSLIKDINKLEIKLNSLL